MTYPVALNLEGRACTVLGGTPLAAEKVRGLVDAGARVTVIAAEICPALETLAGNGAVQLRRRDFLPGDLAGALLVIDASGDETINQQSFAEAEACGALVNVVDRPQFCRFIAPAIVRRDPLMIAISTSGESPYLASALRARLERLIGEEWGPFTTAMGRTRRNLRAKGVSIDEQTRVYGRLLRSGVRRKLREGAAEPAQFEAAAIESSAGTKRPGRVALVGAGPGDPALITIAGLELLAEADHVFHDALLHPRMLSFCGPHATLVDVGKRAGRPGLSQPEITSRMIEAAEAGHDVVRLKGGDPFLFGRGGEEMAELRRAGLDVIVVPGVSSALAAPAAASIPVTMRGFSSSVGITTGHDRAGASPERLEELALAVDTLVVLMPLGNLEAIAARLVTALGPDRPAALVAAATFDNQMVVRARIADIARAGDEAGIEAPATLVVGEVVDAVSTAEVQGLAERGSDTMR